MKILCAGIKEFDSGKTTLCLALIKYFKERSEKICGFKPKSGNNLWYHWGTIKEGLKEGIVYSKDAKLMQQEADLNISILLLNPIHRIWMPISNKNLWTSLLPGFVLDRIAINGKCMIALNNTIDLSLVKNHFKKLLASHEVKYVRDRKDLEELTPLYENAVKFTERELSKLFEHIIYESYSNIALPLGDINDLDYAFVIKPFRINIYDGQRYLMAHETISSISLLEEDTTSVIEVLKPLVKLKIPPYSENIADNLKNEIAPVLDDLFSL
ncbi:MAG: hypothetical protein ACTSXH_00255 [Promethearchaeota archaeon]